MSGGIVQGATCRSLWQQKPVRLLLCIHAEVLVATCDFLFNLSTFKIRCCVLGQAMPNLRPLD
jgi:hypothetical protein